MLPGPRNQMTKVSAAHTWVPRQATEPTDSNHRVPEPLIFDTGRKGVLVTDRHMLA